MQATSKRGMAGIFAAALMLTASAANAALVISNGATSNVVCTTGVCTATAAAAVLNAGALQTMLARSNMKVTTGTAATDIVIAAPVRWPERRELTLEAPRSVRINAEVTVAGHGAVTFPANNGEAPSFGSAGRLTFAALPAALNIRGRTYALVNSVASMAAAAAANLDGAIALAQDYDAGPDGVYPDSPVPRTFTGDFNGLGHTISNFSLAFVGELGGPPKVIGLFAELGSGGTIENISLTDAEVSSANNFANLGLLAGQNRGTISRAAVAGRVVTADANVLGGLVGFNVGTGTISNCRSLADVVNGFFSGGLVGFNQGVIRKSYATGAVSNQEEAGVAGGLVGSSDRARDRLVEPTIAQSFATGAVAGNGRFAAVGGLLGISTISTVLNSYATGPVSAAGARGERYIGGLIGDSNQTILGATYANGAITGVAGDRIGGVAGHNMLPNLQLAPTNYWNRTTTNVARGAGSGVPGFTGRTSAQLKAQLPAGFNPAIWGQSPAVNGGFPFLKALVAGALTLPLQDEEKALAIPAARQDEPGRLTIALQPPPRIR